MSQPVLIQKLQFFFVETTTLGVWGNLFLNHFPSVKKKIFRN